MSVKSNSTVSNSRVADEKTQLHRGPSHFSRNIRQISPTSQAKNPVMFVVYLGSIITTLLGIQAPD